MINSVVFFLSFRVLSLLLGSYDEFDLANETDTLEQFLRLAPPVEDNNGKEVSNDN